MDWIDAKGFELASQSSTQLMSLAVGILALIAASRVATKGMHWQRYALAGAWLFYFLSFFFGMWFLLAITGSVATEEESGYTYGVIKPKPQELPTADSAIIFEPAPVFVRIKTDDIRSGKAVDPEPVEKPSIWSQNSRTPMFRQIVSFAIASVITGAVFIAEILRGLLRPRVAAA